MTIKEGYETAEQAKERAGELIGSAKGPNPVYGLQVTGVIVSGPQASRPLQTGWIVEIDTKLVELPGWRSYPDPEVPTVDSLMTLRDSAYQKVLEENAVLRRSNARMREATRHLARHLTNALKDET